MAIQARRARPGPERNHHPRMPVDGSGEPSGSPSRPSTWPSFHPRVDHLERTVRPARSGSDLIGEDYAGGHGARAGARAARALQIEDEIIVVVVVARAAHVVERIQEAVAAEGGTVR